MYRPWGGVQVVVITLVVGWGKDGGWPCICHRAWWVVLVMVLLGMFPLGAGNVGREWQALLVPVWDVGW